MKARIFLIFAVVLALWSVPAAAEPPPDPHAIPAQAVDPIFQEHLGADAWPPPSTPVEVIDAGKASWGAIEGGAWALAMGFGVFTLMALFRLPALGALVKRVPARWRITVALGLSAASALGFAAAGIVPTDVLALLVPGSTAASTLLHETGEAMRGARGQPSV
jgi:hypothetical protein